MTFDHTSSAAYTEKFHSTPETQTDDSYIHPEDLEHFAHHDAIERKEAEKEAKFQGMSVEEVIKSHHDAEQAALKKAAEAPQVPIAPHPHDEQVGNVPVAEPPSAAKPRVTRVTPPEKQDPEIRYKDAKNKKGDWGSGPGGYKPPVEPGDKMR